MKRFLLAATLLSFAVSDLAIAQDAQRDRRPPPTTRPAPPTQPGGPAIQPVRPGGPAIQPPRPGGPAIQPPRPGGPAIQPSRPGRPGANRPRPPHRPGVRPPNFRPLPGPVFRYPRGYRYQRWVVGRALPWIFLSNAYYFNNYAALGVGPPPPGTRWVRYGPDLLLVRGRDARILDVIYNAFR